MYKYLHFIGLECDGYGGGWKFGGSGVVVGADVCSDDIGGGGGSGGGGSCSSGGGGSCGSGGGGSCSSGVGGS